MYDFARNLVKTTDGLNDGIKQPEVRDLLDRYAELSPDLEVLARERAEELGDTYARIGTITKGKRSTVHPQMPMDLLGLSPNDHWSGICFNCSMPGI